MDGVPIGTMPLKPPRSRLGALGWSAVAAGVLLAFPLLAVVANVLQGGGGSFAHLAATVLPRYIGNTVLLLAGVSWGVISIGVLSAWLVTAYQFPGRRLLEWGLMLPLAMPAALCVQWSYSSAEGCFAPSHPTPTDTSARTSGWRGSWALAARG